jgi:lipopolysaccharide transport system ATP-binding protein
MSVAIHDESLGERYRIGGRTLYFILRDRPTNQLKSPGRWLGSSTAGHSASDPHYVWALRNVSSDLQEGEVLGLIGRNGASKATSQKTAPKVNVEYTNL